MIATWYQDLVLRSTIARVLWKLGQPQQASKELERGLERAHDEALYDALNLFVLYVRIAETEHLPLSSGYMPLLRETLEWWGIQLPPALLEAPSGLAEAVRTANELHWAAIAQFEALKARLPKRRDWTPDVADQLRAYMESESVGLYRRLAQEELRDFETSQGLDEQARGQP